jgi:hypothetical protein
MKSLTGSISFYSNRCADDTTVNGYENSLATIDEVATKIPPNSVTDTLPFFYEVKSATLQAFSCSGGGGVGASSGIGSVLINVAATNASLKASGTGVNNPYIVLIGAGAAIPYQP